MPDCVVNGCPLREYFESRLDSLDGKMEIRIAAANQALELASKATDRRLDDLNHIREQQREQNSNFVNREWYDSQHAFLSARMDGMNTFFNARVDQIRDREESLEKLAANLQGKMWMLVACLGAVFTIIQIVMRFVGK